MSALRKIIDLLRTKKSDDTLHLIVGQIPTSQTCVLCGRVMKSSAEAFPGREHLYYGSPRRYLEKLSEGPGATIRACRPDLLPVVEVMTS